jgi:hypothetical protein
MKKILGILISLFMFILLSSCGADNDAIKPGVKYKCDGYSYWYFKQIDYDYVDYEIKGNGEYFIVSSYEEAEKHDTYGNIVNQLCANNSETFYDRNKLLVFYIKYRNIIKIDSIINDDNELVVKLRTNSVMAGVTPSNRCVIKLSNSEYKKINEIRILLLDEDGNNI